jgi:hypothetical protein
MTQAAILSQLGSQGTTQGFKNRIINGNMAIAQRGAGATTVTVNGSYTTCDRWQNLSSASSKFSVQQSTTAPTGFNYSSLITSLSAYTAGASEQFAIRQNIEGYNFADLGWGTINAKTITLSFWVRSSLTGTFGGALCNEAGDRSYPYTYTISAANTWEQKSITIAGDTSGTWTGATTGIGVCVAFGLGAGSTYSGTAGTWGSAYYVTATGATSVVGTNGATFYITGVQLEVGSTATNFDVRSYGTELQLCQRYYEVGVLWGSGYGNGTNGVAFSIPMKATKRTTPSGTSVDNGGSVNATGFTFNANDANSCYVNFGSNAGYIRGNAAYTVSAEL